MSFLFPAFLLGALAAAAPILLHFFARDRAPRLPFSDVRFLERAFVRHDRRRRLRELLLLALRVAALLLLAVAFARPFLDAAGGAQRVTVLVVDRSLSLSAPGQMALARERAREAIASTSPDEPIAVVAFDDRAAVLQPPALGRPAVQAALGRIEPTTGATRHAAGLAAAIELLDGRAGRVVVVTDLQASGWPDDARVAIPVRVSVEVAAVAPVERNLAVTAADVDADADVDVDVDVEELTVSILNTGPAPAETEVTLDVDGYEVARRPVTLLPGGNEVRWALPATDAEVATVSVTDRYGYRWDDTRYALLDRASATVVLVVVNGGTLDAEAFYLAQALAVAPASRPFEVRPVAPGALPALLPSAWEAGDVVVVIGTDGLSRSGRGRIASFVENGGGLLLATGPGIDPRLVRDLLGESVALGVEMPVETAPDGAVHRLAVMDPRHPVFRPFGDLVATLGHVRFTGMTRILPPRPADAPAGADSPAHVLARFDQGDPALIEYDPGVGRALVLASDLGMEWNDFPRHPGFVPFVQEIVRYLAGPAELPRELLPSEVPGGIPRQPGVATDPASGRRVAVNVDSRESEPRALTQDGFLARLGAQPAGGAGAVPIADGAAREAEQSLWWYVVLAVAVALVGEAWLGRTMA